MLGIIITTKITSLTNSVTTPTNQSKAINLIKQNISKNKKICNEK